MVEAGARRSYRVRYAIGLSVLIISFAVPFVPSNGNPFQLAGFFPRFVSPSCALFHIGVALGPNSFLGMRWVLSPFCNLQG